jgi:2-succinyl-5-enolpyruvyl-6-hydroxy-3-cyclohexene-1-carboxylate synthase
VSAAAATGESAALFCARALLDELVRAGLRSVCLAPGSRSTSLALAVAERPELTSHVVLDERSMGFFALGIARATRRPVAVVCTSGTAAANLLPAAVEASLAGGALLLLTADRPPEQRECATPQIIDQLGLFGSHARWAVDVPILDASAEAARVLRSVASRAAAIATQGEGGAVQLNVGVREPFVDASFPARAAFDVSARDGVRPFTEVLGRAALSAREVRELAARLKGAARGVILCAGAEAPAAEVALLARALGWPVLADPLSGLRFGLHDRSHVVDAIEPLLRSDALRAELRPDAILRFGLTPVPRSVQRWLEVAWPAEHIVVSEAAWPDPTRTATTIVRAEAAELCRELAAECSAPESPGRATGASSASGVSNWLDRWLWMSSVARDSLETSLAHETTLFDALALRSVAAALPDGATLVVGNSMPVRDAEAFLASDASRLRILANRGASGIDGVLSTALGIAAASRDDGPTALVVGDLSFLHDSGALAMAARDRIPLLVVVVNNDGGGIFSYLPIHDTLERTPAAADAFERYFGTPHGADLERISSVTGAYFSRVEARQDLDATISAAFAASAAGPAVVEVRTDREAGRRAQQAIVHAAQAAVTGAASIRRSA